jgi:hypothetical protein
MTRARLLGGLEVGSCSVASEVRLPVGDQVVVIRGDAVSRQDVVQETLEGRLVPRIAWGKEEVRRPGVVGGGQAAAVGQAPFSSVICH